MNKGVLVIARNNNNIDYVKQAVYLAKKVKKHLDLPTSIITDNIEYLNKSFDPEVFDHIISVGYESKTNTRSFYDGGLASKTDNFKNASRSSVYDLTPYDETLLLDSDFVVNNNLFLNCFDSDQDLLLYKDSYDLSNNRNTKEFEFISDSGCDFYWATCVFFRKTERNKMFFDLIKHIQEEWNHYRRLYQIQSQLFRNDFAFSIAIHILNGFNKGNFAGQMPGKLTYITDQDILWNTKDETMTFLVAKKDYLGEYHAIAVKDMNIHVMNKFSLSRIIDQEMAVEQ
jgi:hypothetical protein